MKRLIFIFGLGVMLLPVVGEGDEPSYFRAEHGFNKGFKETVDLSAMEGFEAVTTIRELAEFASAVDGAIGFTAHPQFEVGTRYATAILWYTNRSSPQTSWPLYLFDESEAKKAPGEAALPTATAAADLKITGKREQAQRLITEGGENGVTLSGDYEERKLLAFAVMRLGGFVKHTGSFTDQHCVSCRSVVPGGTPVKCGLGTQEQEHWNCCGASRDDRYCRYWEMIKAQDDSEK